MIVLDSSFIVSLFLPDDENHAKALELFGKHSAEEMLCTDIVLFETMTVLNYKKGIAFVKDANTRLMENRKLQIVYLNENERKEILAEFLEQTGKMSMEDVSVVHTCSKTLSSALTFDKEILKKLRRA